MKRKERQCHLDMEISISILSRWLVILSVLLEECLKK